MGRPWLEFIENLVIGVTLIGWSLRHFWQLPESAGAVEYSVLTLNVVAGVLLLVRTHAAQQGSWQKWAWAFPCILMGAVVFSLAPPSIDWSVLPQIVFVLGTGLTIVSLLSLGRSFSIFPARRGVVTYGPYAWVRHPAYLGECLMAVGCLVACPTISMVLVLFVLPLFVVWRIHQEEDLMEADAKYVDYRQRVRWRLIPGVW